MKKSEVDGRTSADACIETELSCDVGWTASIFGFWVIEGCQSADHARQEAVSFMQSAVTEKVVQND